MTSVTVAIDAHLERLVRRLPDWLSLCMRFLSFIGRPVFTIVTAIAIGAYALFVDNPLLLLSAIIAGATFALNSIIKLLVRRPRPDGYTAEKVLLPTYSFPSGHASSCVVIFGLLGMVVYSLLPVGWNIVSAIVFSVAIIGIGISRVYRSAHWPTDVLIGWIVGGTGLTIIMFGVQPL